MNTLKMTLSKQCYQSMFLVCKCEKRKSLLKTGYLKNCNQAPASPLTKNCAHTWSCVPLLSFQNKWGWKSRQKSLLIKKTTTTNVQLHTFDKFAKRFAEGHQPDKIVALILIWIQEAVVEWCLMEGFLSAAWGCRGSAQRSETAPGRRHGGQTGHRQAALASSCQGPWGHNISRIVTVTRHGVAPTAAVWVPRAPSAAVATCAGHWTCPTGALMRSVAWHRARPTKNSPRSTALLFKASGQCCYLATFAGWLANWLACVLAS